MSVEIQGDFSNYFDMVQDKATQSQFYLDIQKHFNEGKIDGKIYASLMIEFHKDTLSQAIETGRAMAIGIRELELKTNESVASVANMERRTVAIGEELFIKATDSVSNRAVNTERIALINRQKDGFDDNLRIKDAEIANGVYGAIQSGGLEAPASLVTYALETLPKITNDSNP